jgi:hypothetical protein
MEESVLSSQGLDFIVSSCFDGCVSRVSDVLLVECLCYIYIIMNFTDVNRIEITNKMLPCSRNYYSSVS